MTSCKIFHSAVIEREELFQKLDGYSSKPFEIEGLERPLIDNIENFEKLDNGVKFLFLHDYVQNRIYRDEIRRDVATEKAEVKVSYQHDFILFFVYSPKEIANRIRLKLSRAINGTTDLVRPYPIAEDTLRRLETSIDVEELTSASWELKDAYTHGGSLRGVLKKSRYYSDFEGSGQPKYVRFLSRSENRTVAISSEGIVTFYGKDASLERIEDYIMKEIILRKA